MMSNSGTFLANVGLSHKAFNELISRTYSFGKLALVLLIIFLSVKVLFALFKPLPESIVQSNSATPAPASGGSDLSILETYDPFRHAETGNVEVAEAPLITIESTLDIRVSGIWRLPNGSGSAIMQTSDGVVSTYVTGDEVEDGVTLERIERDRVIISRSGVLESIRVDAQREQREARQGTGDFFIEMQRLSEIIILRPVRNSDGSRSGLYTIMPGRDIQAFAATGIKEGDIIEQINGTEAPRDPNSLFDIFGQMQPRDMLALVVNRQGEQVYLSIEVQGAV